MDYEKEYKEALERARQVHTTNVDENKKSAEYIFPVLKESEDEKIRGAIIDHLKDYNLTEWADWLEKQGELPHWKKSTLPNNNVPGFNSDYFIYNGYYINYKELFNKLPKDDFEKQNKQILANSAKTCKDEQKLSNVESIEPAWSEEDEGKFRDIIGLIEQSASILSIRDHYTNWLKSLKERIQSKQEWSEEDEEEFMSLIGYMSYNGMYDSIHFLRRKLNR